MQGASRGSLAAAQDRLSTLLADTGTDGVDRAAVADALFGVADVLDGAVSLRRALTDPSTDGDRKAALVGQLLDGKVPGAVVDLLSGMVRDRWSRTRDLPDALDVLGADAVLADAEAHDRLDAVEDELFRFRRTVDGDPALAAAVADRRATAQAKAQLVATLLQGKVAPETERLVRQAVVAPHGQRFDAALEQYGDLAATRREQLVAHVVVALPLTEAHRDRLRSALQQQYGRPVQLQEDVDGEVVGGIRVEIGDEVLDGTVQRKLDDVRQRFAR